MFFAFVYICVSNTFLCKRPMIKPMVRNIGEESSSKEP